MKQGTQWESNHSSPGGRCCYLTGMGSLEVEVARILIGFEDGMHRW